MAGELLHFHCFNPKSDLISRIYRHSNRDPWLRRNKKWKSIKGHKYGINKSVWFPPNDMVRPTWSRNFISACPACAARGMQTFPTIPSTVWTRNRPRSLFIWLPYHFRYEMKKLVYAPFSELTWFWEVSEMSGACNDCISTKYIKKPATDARMEKW